MPACSSSQGAARILLVDDDACFRRALAIALGLEGYEVLEAGNSAEALAQFETGPVALAVVDLLLGTERGEALLERIARLSPGTRLATMSGRPSLAPLVGRLKVSHLEKPLDAAKVIALLA